eukprot:1865363-Rhodomonas_salina.1
MTSRSGPRAQALRWSVPHGPSVLHSNRHALQIEPPTSISPRQALSLDRRPQQSIIPCPTSQSLERRLVERFREHVGHVVPALD